MSETTFASRLKAAMEEKGLKQVDLINLAQQQGQALGKSQLSQYLSGKNVPRAGVLEFLAHAVGKQASWLAGEQATMRAASDAENGAADDVEDVTVGGTKAIAASGVQDAAPGKPAKAPAVPAEPDAAPVDTLEVQFGTYAAVSPPSDSSISVTTGTTAPEVTPSKQAPKEVSVREFKKSSKLDDVLYDVRGPVVAMAAKMEEEGTQVLKLNLGNPAPFGFRTPDEVVHDMARQLVDCEGYSDSKGLYSARKAIMQYAQIKGLPNVHMDGIFTGNGVSELINMCLSALLDNGDEILIPAPDYPLWTACATLAGGVPVHYVCDEKAEWNPDLDDIRKKVTPRTKAIVIINPNNPTGALYDTGVLQEIVEIARQNQLIIFSDEIYDRLVMDELEHTSIASLAPDLFCITFSGLSKSHMIAGYRAGWMVLSGPRENAADYIEGLNMLSNMRLCSNVPAQSIIQTALWGHQSVKNYVVPGGRVREQRDYIYDALNSIDGISAVKPKAAFYIFPKLDVKKFNIADDVQFAVDLLREQKLLIVQGTGFNWKQPDHFRIVYLPRVEELQDAVGRLESFLATYKQR